MALHCGFDTQKPNGLRQFCHFLPRIPLRTQESNYYCKSSSQRGRKSQRWSALRNLNLEPT